MLRLGYFERAESVSHLRRRLPAIAAADAEAVAAELGDMPLAMAAAGALLASTEAVHLRVPGPAPGGASQAASRGHPLLEYPQAVAKAWHLSLEELERQSAAAARLLRTWAVMATGDQL